MSQSVATRMMLAADAIMTTPTFLEFEECSLVGKRAFGATEGHRGTRQPASCRARILSDMCAGAFGGRLSVAEIDYLMPLVFGTTASSTLIPGETIGSFYALVDKVAAIYLYNKLRINKFEVSGTEGDYLKWVFDCMGELETTYGSSWPASPAFPECGTAFIFSDVVFTYSGTTYKPQSFKLSIDNKLAPLTENAITPYSYEAQDMDVSLEMSFDFRTNNLALYRAALAGAAASLAFSDGTTTYTFSFANLKIPDGGPTIPKTGRVNMPLQMKAYRATNITTNAADNVVRLLKT